MAMELFRLIATLCLSIHTLCGIAAAQVPTIEVAFQVTAFLEVDGRAVCLCTVDKRGSDVVSTMTWRHNGTIIAPIPNRIIIDTDLSAGLSELEIDALIPSDAGTYNCRADFSIPNGVSLMESDTLSVATNLVVTAAEEQDFVEGDTANLTCSAVSSPLPSIRWFRVNEDGSETTLTPVRQEAEDEDFGVFRIVDVKRSDGGLYRCEGSYNFGRESVMIRLFITAFPEIITPPRINSEVVKGENLTLDCETASQRPPDYVWSFEGEELVNNSRVSVGTTTGQLNISNVTFADTGTYNCFVQNDLGNDTQNSTVLVAGAPEIITPNDTVTFAGAGNRVALNCSFLAHPLPTIEWSKLSGGDYVPLNVNSDARLSINATNGSLLILEAVGIDRGSYSCDLSNTFGSDTRFNITLKVIERAPAPSTLRIIDGTRDRDLSLEWDYDLDTLPEYRLPEHFIVEARLDDNSEYEMLDQYFLPNLTAGILMDLIPGTQFHIRIRAANLAGFSAPTNQVLHTTEPSIPQFLFFNATALDDGRTILLRWELEFDGGPDVILFEVEFRDSSGRLLDTFDLDINDGRYLIENLEPNTTYMFTATALNDIGATAPITAEAMTTLAPPSKPTQPTLVERTIQSLAFSFSVEFGSRPIDYFVLNITEDMAELLQLNFSITDDQYIEELTDVLSEESGEVIGYFVVIRVRNELENQREYVFEVAAGSEIGLGEFSNSSDPFRLKDERLIYYIIGAVVGGVIVVIIVIIVVIAIACCVKRFRRRGRTMLITGKHTVSTTSTDFMLTEERYNTDVDIGIGNVDRADTTSPYYNKLNQYHNGGQSYGIDEPDARFSTSPNSIPNSQAQNRLSGYSSTLPRASVGSGPTYPDSMVSSKNFPVSPPGTLKGADPTISFSTPAINDRYSSDVDTLQKSTSYMTDV